jgi:hypothetical protein
MLRIVSGIIFFLLATQAFGQVTMPVDGSYKNEEDSIRYTNLKEKMSRNKLTRRIYSFVFRDVYNQRKKEQVKKIEENAFDAFDGLIIGDIVIRQLDVLGESVYDTSRKGNKLENFLSRKLHSNTREKIIRSYFLFESGEAIDAKKLQDNERIIRNNPTILDVRIIVVPREDPDWMADIVVLIQDRWSIVPSVGISGISNFKLGLSNNNLLGSATRLYNSVRWNAQDSIQRFQTRTIYTVPYIGKSFISAHANLIWEREIKQRSIGFGRPFLTTDTKYAGAVEVGQSRVLEIKRFAQNPHFVLMYPVEYNFYDMWFGRAFRLRKPGRLFADNVRLVPAFRINQYRYTERPDVRADANKIYWNRRTMLLSLGISDRNYKRDVLIYGFGRTEDVPVGSMASVTFGREETEFGTRGYGGVQVSRGQYLSEKAGYLYGLASFGSYLKNKNMQQGVLSTSVDYISRLYPLRNRYFRQFVSLRYTKGINRDPLEYLNISGRGGIRGVRSEYLIGTERLSLGLETVLFSSKSFIGFRLAYFTFADLSFVTRESKVWKSPLYQAYGLGIRLQNENLAINTLQLRVGYYHNIPMINSPVRVGVEGISRLMFRDFDISAPSIVPLM